MTSAERQRRYRARCAAERVRIPRDAPELLVVQAIDAWLDGKHPYGPVYAVDWLSRAVFAVASGEPIDPLAQHRVTTRTDQAERERKGTDLLARLAQ